MKKILTIIFALCFFVAAGQRSAGISIEWADRTEVPYANSKARFPYPKDGDFRYDAETRSLVLIKRIKIAGPVDAGAVTVNNISYESIPADVLGDIPSASLPEGHNIKVRPIRARDLHYIEITMSPIVRNGSGIRRVKSFSYQIGESTSRSAATSAPAVLANSVLASGDWYRFYVEKSGVYKISRNFLQSLGMNVSGDPSTFKIYGNGGRMVPLLNSAPYPNDLEENAIQVIGGDDGSFDSSDYILFYAEGVDNWSPENATHNNLYADRSYYYVTKSGGPGKRIAPMDPLTGATPTATFTTFDDYQYYEKDLLNVVRLGRRWVGEQFNIDNEQEFNFNFPNVVATEPMTLSAALASASFNPTSFTIQANGQQVANLNFGSLVPNSGTEMVFATLQPTAFPAAQDVTVKLTFNNNGVPSARGFLDFIIIRGKRQLTGYGKQFRFRVNQAATLTGVGEFVLANASNIGQVWDITDIYNVTSATNNGQSTFTFRSPLGQVREFIAVDNGDFLTPQKESNARVANQNLKGTIFNNAQGQFQDINYLIITPQSLANQAERLANFHREYAALNVKVVKLADIYQEFGSGKQDIGAIRNFVKYVYDNASSDATRLQYLNLFGDASFDFKERIPDNTNLVPIYHALNSNTAGELSFTTDDFFGLMDPDEGRIDYFTPSGSIAYDFGGVDIAVGRIIADSPNQADEMVNKVIEYHDIKSYGSWRNNIVMISDDSDKTSDQSLQHKQNVLADEITSEKPFFNVRKIFLDSYEQETSAGGNRYPKARQDLFNAFEKGALVFNYLGHGGEDGLSGERIWEKSDGQNLQNRYRYPLFITITCDFSRFDNPYRPTAGEYTFWNERGGAIAMITTVRSIGQFQAEQFNDKLSEYLFFYDAGEGPRTSIAESLRRAKNDSSNSAANVVVFLGDPAVFLAIPEPKIILTHVNDQPITGPVPDFQALAPMKITGQVTDENNIPLTNYNGELSVNIFDKIIERQTLNNDGFSPPINFNVLGETIFRGNASVASGQFEFNFVVPRDIRIPLGNGRISFYARRNVIREDKTGYDNTIRIGGINENAVADNTGPTVKLYMNDQTFISGGITNENPIFLAFLEDEHGINTASGIGHDIVAILDGDESNPYILNDYYETELDDFTKGKLRFPLRDLEKGLHTITFKAWDVYNNPITAEIQFVVVDGDGITLTNVLNYPNPFVNHTQFWFTHNRPFEPLEVQVQVITVTGKVVWTRNQVINTEGYLSREITWDGRDDFGDRIGKGVYIYKLTVKSTLTNSKSEKYEKLVIL